ncbi:MAG: alpha-glucosidase [Eubacteriales bacterium]|nr:alpha-glucosidase [Eubacteriales bacterium]
MERKWWKEAIGYELYLKSFKDTNEDGIGDLRGIIEKLPYLKELGISLLWICPFYPSPMRDNGYDVADYYGIDPRYGTMKDMEELLSKAKEAEIRVIIDMVLNHTSDQHPWFQEALKNPDSKYRQYYIFRDSKERPSNARSCFGGSVWEEAEEGVWYYHTFAKEQPDLNWECPLLRAEIHKILKFWLEKGVSGFRLDAITYIKKGASLAMAEPDGPDGLHDVGSLGQNQPGIGEFLKEMRQVCLDGTDAMTVAEAPGVPYEELGEFIGEDGYFSMVFDFSYADIDLLPGGNWYNQAPWTFKELKELIFKSQCSVQKQGWGAVYLENHDQSRSLNKYFREKAAAAEEKEKHFLQASALAVLLMGLRGTVFLYQGEELGMVNCPFSSVDEFDDLNTKDQYQRALQADIEPEKALKYVNDRSRDNSRTPFPWSGEKNAGFTQGVPWLKVNPDHTLINARQQSEDMQSLYHFYQKLIALRKDPAYLDVLVYGKIEEIPVENEGVIAFCRTAPDGKEIQIWVNMTEEKVSAGIHAREVLADNYQGTEIENGILMPYQACMILV